MAIDNFQNFFKGTRLDDLIVGNSYICKNKINHKFKIKVLDKNKDNVKVEFSSNGPTTWLSPHMFQTIEEIGISKENPKVKWYKKGKLSQEEDWVNESFEEWDWGQFKIGKTYKCAIKYNSGGIGINPNPGYTEMKLKILDKKKSYFNDKGQLKVEFPSGDVNWIAPNFKVIVDDVEKPKVKWYKKGKLSQEEDWVNEAKDSKDIANAEWDKRWEDLSKFEIGKTYKCVSFGNSYEITVLEKNYKCQMKIRFKRLGNFTDAEQWVNASKFTILDEVTPKQPHVKWYKKGKLSQGEDWINESEQGDRLFKATMQALDSFNKGDTCKIKDSLIYLYSDKVKYGKYAGIESKITNKGFNKVEVEFPDGVKAWIHPLALNKVIPKQHVKWYSKGKFFDGETDWD